MKKKIVSSKKEELMLEALKVEELEPRYEMGWIHISSSTNPSEPGVIID
jgi:hypothetical protein